MASAVAAHDGPHGPAIIAQVERAVASGLAVEVDFVVTGLGTSLVLNDVWVPMATAQFDGPVPVGFAQDVPVSAMLTFTGPPPPAFTLMLDFGFAGQGALSVTLGN